MVSTTTTLPIVTAPALLTTIRYATPSPIPPPPTCSFATTRLSSGASTVNPTAFVSSVVALQESAARTNAVFETAVAAHTSPTDPVIVNV